MKTNIVILTTVLVFGMGLGGGYLFRNYQIQKQSASSSGQVAAENTTNGPIKEFTVVGTNFSFSPAKITVNKGDTVKINFRDDDGRHNLIIDGYNVATDVLSGGEQSIQFVADKAGSFEYYCSVSNHRDLGMTGSLIVE